MSPANQINELEPKLAEQFLAYVVDQIKVNVRDEEWKLNPASRLYYTGLGTLGFVSQACHNTRSFTPSSHYFVLSDKPFKVILVPTQTIKLYQSMADTSETGLETYVDGWFKINLEIEGELKSAGFKNQYAYRRENFFRFSSLSGGKSYPDFVYIPNVERDLWDLMTQIDLFYVENIGKKVPGFGVVRDVAASEQESQPSSNSQALSLPQTGLVNFIGFNPPK